MTAAAERAGSVTAHRLPPGVDVRPAVAADVAACAVIWRDALNDYMGRLNLPEVPDDLAAIRRLHAHLYATDPGLFWVAARDGGPPIGFGAAVRRDDVWFLSMLFVRPGEQGRGIGASLLRRLLPDDDAVLAIGTDSAQPISNALYSAHGVVPRMPLLSLVGHVEAVASIPALPAGVRPVAFDDAAAGASPREGNKGLAQTVDQLDREVLGFAHPQDHAYLRAEGRRGFLYVGAAGPLGYGYTSEVGRVGPVAVRDPVLVGPVLGHLLDAVRPRGAFAVWVPGEAGDAVVALLRAGLRLDGFPVLLCWTRPFADFRRYLPISPGLL